MRTQSAKAVEVVDRLGASTFAEIADAHGTPFYVYSAELIEERIAKVLAALGTELFYSIKANPSLGVCQVIAATGIGAEVASSGELAVALAAGFAPDRIVFAGPGKTDDEVQRLVAGGIHADNVESLAEIERLAHVAANAGKRAGVALRINPEQQLMGAQMRMGGGATQFGIDEADLAAAVAAVLSHPAELALRGIHVYTATQIFDPEPLLAHTANVLDIALRTADLAGAPLAFIDFGGGFGVPYFDKLPDFDLEAFGAGVRELLRRHAGDPRLAGTRFHFELGRYLVAEAGVYVMRVIDVKETRGTTFAITDGGMNHHLTATGNMGQVFRKSFPLANVTRIADEPTAHVAVVGPLCTPLDSFGQDVAMAAPQVGDLIGVFHSGAYGYSASNLGFLSHPAPAEVMIRNGELHLLRPAAKPEDVLLGQLGVL